VLKVKEEQYADAVQDNKAAWVSLATTVLPTVLTGFSSLSGIIGTIRSTQQTATGATNLLATATTGLGTAATTTGTRGITPLVTGLKNFVLGGKDTTTVLGTKTNGLVGGISALNLGFTDTEKSGNIFIRTFKNLGTSVKDFFSRIKTDIGASTGIIDKIKTGFSSFFTQVGTGFKGFGGHLKTAGAAFVAFGKTLLGVFMSNPILLVITAIATAIGALIFDLGGFRTRLNEVGVTLGKMAPWAKPFLDALGWIGQQFAAVGDWIMGTNKLADATSKGGAAAKKAAADFDTHFQAIQKVFNVSKDFSKFEGIVNNLKNVKTEIDKMTETTNVFGTKTVQNLGNAATSFETFNAGIIKGVPEIDAKVKEIQQTFRDMENGTISLAEGEKLLGKQLGELEGLLVDNIHTNQNKIKTDKESAVAMKGTTTVMTEAEREIKLLNAATLDSEETYKKFAMAYATGNYDIIQSMKDEGVAIDQLLDRYNKDYPQGAKVITENGVKIIKSFKDINEEGKKFATDITAMVKDASKTLTADLLPTLDNITLSIQKLSKEEELQADISRLAATGIYNDKTKLAETVKALAVKYSLTRTEADKALKDIQSETQNLVKEQDKATKSIDEMVTAEEKAKQVTDEWKASMDKIAQSFQTFGSKGTSQLQSVGQKLLDIADKARAASEEFVTGEGKRKERKEKFHETMMKLYDEETKAIGDMDVAVARQSHVWAEWSTMATESVNNFAASALVGEFPAAITAIETALDATPDQWKGASGQLTEILDNTALNARDKANLIAADMGMLENAMKPVQVGAEFVGKAGAEAAAGLDELATAALKNVNPMTEMDSAWKTFTSSLTPAQKELGLVQAVMKGVESGALTAAQGFQILETAGVEASKQIGSTVTTSLANLEHQIIQLGNGTTATVAKMDGQWVSLGTSAQTNLGTSGTAVQNLESELTMLGGTAQTELGSTVPGAISTASTTANTQFTQIVNYANLVIEVFKALSTYAQTYIAGGIKMAIDAAVASFSLMSTNIGTYATSMITSIGAWITASTTSMGAFIPVINLVTNTFTALQNGVTASMTAMTTATGAWITAAIKSMGELMKVIATTQKSYTALQTGVKTNMTSMTTYTSNFVKTSNTQLTTLSKTTTTLGKAFTTMGSQTKSAMSQAASAIKSFSSSSVSALKKVESAAKSATSALKAMAAAAAKAKAARSGLRFGGAFVTGGQTMNQSSYAQTGKSWINSRPRKIGGVNISEFSKPELVTVTPLSNPSDPMDKGLNYLDGLPAPKLQMPDMSNMGSGSGSGRASNNQPINMTLHTTVTMPDGKVLAKAVQSHLLNGFSGIT
jgi:hypothetical protein